MNNSAKLKCGYCKHRMQCFFSSLTQEEYDFLNKNKTEVDYKAGETIYKQGTVSKYLIFLLSGMAKVLVEGENDKNFIIQLVKPFHFLDFPAIFDNDMLYHTSIAIEDSRACLIDIETFKSIVLSNKKNIPRLVRHYNEFYNRFSQRLTNVIYKNMEARLADVLLYLVNEVYYSRSFTLNISRKDLAELAGMSKESTSRILSQLKEQEVLRIQGKNMEVLNKKYLEQLSRIG